MHMETLRINYHINKMLSVGFPCATIGNILKFKALNTGWLKPSTILYSIEICWLNPFNLTIGNSNWTNEYCAKLL